MVLITTTFGPICKYKHPDMARKTFGLFLGSLSAQTSKNFKVFLPYHETLPVEIPDFVVAESIGPADASFTRVLKINNGLLKTGQDSYTEEPFDCPLTDMSRKSFHGAWMAYKWARDNKLRDFWILRMDSDDMLWTGMVKFLEDMTKRGVQAVYNMKCHMFDVRTLEMGEFNYPYSTTCNALFFNRPTNRLSRLFYHCEDHTTFITKVRKDGIVSINQEFTLCVTTNSGNSLSGRTPIGHVPGIKKLELSLDLCKWYGLDPALAPKKEEKKWGMKRPPRYV